MFLEFKLTIPVNSALKRNEKEALLNNILAPLKNAGINSVEIKESYYLEHRAAPALLYLVTIISVTADILTITIALKQLLEDKPKRIEKFHLKKGSYECEITGNMSSEDIIKILKEAEKASVEK